MKTISLSREQIHTGDLILVNQKYPYKKSPLKIALMSVGSSGNNVLLERRCAAIYTKLIDELCAHKQITPVSGWRTLEEQEQIYKDSLSENGADFTANYVALPGHSEHQAGLAVDLALNQPDIDSIRPHFPYSGICQAFRNKAARYGFIERYPKGKESITGIAHEPWHFRYVGAPHAMIMDQTGDTLEEYHTRLRQFPFGIRPFAMKFGSITIETSYLTSSGETTVLEVEENLVYTVSGNNMDGFIVTLWRGAA
jgi:D-alanyl-D-alanine dipeptidase/carboxypeptidase